MRRIVCGGKQGWQSEGDFGGGGEPGVPAQRTGEGARFSTGYRSLASVSGYRLAAGTFAASAATVGIVVTRP